MICLFHKWDGCKCTKCGKVRDEFHTFAGCKCTKCGATRDKEHAFTRVPGTCIERCTVCGKEREAHSYQGCQCTVCGKTRDEAHAFRNVPGQCVKKCTVCGKEQSLPHDYGKDGMQCVRCGALNPTPFDLSGLTTAEFQAVQTAVEINRKVNKQPSLDKVYVEAQMQLCKPGRRVGLAEIAILATSVLSVMQAFGGGGLTSHSGDVNETLARLQLALNLKSAQEKINAQLKAFNERNGNGAGGGDAEKPAPAEGSGKSGGPASTKPSNAALYDAANGVFHNTFSVLQLDETGHDWEAPIREHIDTLKKGGQDGVNLLFSFLMRCARGEGPSISESWWHGSTYAVRTVAMFPPKYACDTLLKLLETDSRIYEWFAYVQKEAILALTPIATVKHLPRLEKIAANPMSLSPIDWINELIAKLRSSAPAAPADGGPLFDVALTMTGPNKISVIKAICESTGYGLKEAKSIADNPPATVKRGLSQREADKLVAALCGAGAVCTMDPAAPTPAPAPTEAPKEAPAETPAAEAAPSPASAPAPAEAPKEAPAETPAPADTPEKEKTPEDMTARELTDYMQTDAAAGDLGWLGMKLCEKLKAGFRASPDDTAYALKVFGDQGTVDRFLSVYQTMQPDELGYLLPDLLTRYIQRRS